MMHQADLNVMVCSRALLNVAKQMESKYGIPYFEGSFYGAENTRNTLMSIARHFNDQELLDRTAEVCQKHHGKILEQLTPYKNCLKDMKALLYTGGVKSWSFVSALQELGMEVVATGAKKSTEEDKHRIVELMGEDAVMITDGSPGKLIDLYEKSGAHVLLAGGRNQYTAIKARFPFVHVNQERESCFAGYSGFLNLAREICQAVNSPVFNIVSQSDPFKNNLLSDKKLEDNEQKSND
jgi:nitrogenase molybdenum-cofactor synthesis protein NifE